MYLWPIANTYERTLRPQSKRHSQKVPVGKVLDSQLLVTAQVNLCILGLLHLKKRQDEELSVDEVYIHYAAKLHPSLGNTIHDEDEVVNTQTPIYIIVCMSKESSQ
jgi:hypothetical protein